MRINAVSMFPTGESCPAACCTAQLFACLGLGANIAGAHARHSLHICRLSRVQPLLACFRICTAARQQAQRVSMLDCKHIRWMANHSRQAGTLKPCGCWTALLAQETKERPLQNLQTMYFVVHAIFTTGRSVPVLRCAWYTRWWMTGLHRATGCWLWPWLKCAMSTR